MHGRTARTRARFAAYRRGALLAGVALLVLACSNASPYARRKAYQQQQARRLAAADLEPATRAWHALDRMRVRVYAARDHRERDRSWRSSFEEQIARANAVLEQAVAIKLEIEDAREWDAQSPAEDMHAQLDELAHHDAGDDVDWVIAVIGSTPRTTLNFAELGYATVLGKHIVLRDMNDAEEQRQISEGLDTLDEDERRRLYRERKRHRQTVVLLHELAHTLCAIHVNDPADVMHPAYDNRMRAFAEPNLVLMRRVLEHRGAPAAEQDVPALIAALAAHVRDAPWEGWVAQERAEYVTKLEQALLASRPAPTLGPVAQPAPAPPRPDGPEWDASALPEADRLAFVQARTDADAGRGREAGLVIAALAERHAQSYAVQHFACTLAMRGVLGMSSMQRYCERMTALALDAANPDAAAEQAPTAAPPR